MQTLKLKIRYGSIPTALAIAAALIAATPKLATAARTLVFETFENDVPDVDFNNTKPASVDTYNRSIVVPPEGENSGAYTTGGLFPDPFGPGNQSLLLYNPNAAAQMTANFHRFFDADPTQFVNGVIEFDVFMEAPEPASYWTFLDIRFGFDTRLNMMGEPVANRVVTTTNDVTIWNDMRMQEGGLQGAAPDILFDRRTVSTFNDQQVVAPDRKMHIRYDINGTSKTYTVSIDNLENPDPAVDVVWPGVNPKPWYEIFNFQTFQFEPTPGINVIAFLTDASSRSQSTNVQNLYIDNLRVINNDLPPLLDNADFDADGDVDGADFLTWQRGVGIGSGALLSQGDANGDGAVNAADLTIFRTQFGGGGAVSAAGAVPEPASVVIALAVCLFPLLANSRRRSGAAAA